ncbi:PP2C family protein-serine/threonine phosphatase [Roseibium sp.]|uniref:PP2C family protein-serine/threonine phosphatase n=2 Tax=Roseibium sp. TaxID=1936156 RepID=UPI003D10BA51
MGRTAAVYRRLQEQQSRAVENCLARFANSRILVVEDNSVVLTLITRFLNHYGLRQIRPARNGLEALEIAAEWLPDLIITDLYMPVMDGVEFCRSIRAGRALDDVPVLVLTGIENHEERTAVFEAGATDLISKPVYHLELAGRLQVHLERSQLIRRLTEYKERIALELDQARTMQADMLPDRMLVSEVLETYPVDMASHYQPSIGLGGDLWGLRPLCPNRLFVYILDFSGHGVGAAINTFRFQAYYNSLRDIDTPGQVLNQLNSFLSGILPVGQFATMFCAIIDFECGELTYSSAGAPPALLRPEDGEAGFLPLDGTGFPLGITANADYEDKIQGFPPGSSLFLYSDALVETPDPPNSVFTYDSLAGFLNGPHAGKTCADRVASVLGKLSEGNVTTFEDDATIFCLTYLNREFGSDDR